MKVIEPYDWPAILAWLGARAIPGVEQVEGGEYVRGRVRVRFASGVIRWREDATGSPAVHETRAAGTGSRAVFAARDDTASRVARLFDTRFDPAPMHALFAGDRMLAPRLKTRPGVRVPGTWDPFELMVRAIVGQQISVAGARTILGRIAAAHGFDPNVLAAVTLDGMPRRRAETIRLLARAVASGDGLELEEIPGIGPWTANYIRMRLGDRDAFPAGDLILRRNAGNLTERELYKRAEAWRPFRAYAAMLLWTA